MNMLRVFLGCGLLALFAPLSLYPQTQPGAIRIEVKDSSGAVMRASGRVENLATGVVRSFETDTQGTYTLDNLVAGTYRLEVIQEGFAGQTLTVEVPAGSSVSRTVVLNVSAAASKVDVVATTPLSGVGLSVN